LEIICKVFKNKQASSDKKDIEEDSFTNKTKPRGRPDQSMDFLERLGGGRGSMQYTNHNIFSRESPDNMMHDDPPSREKLSISNFDFQHAISTRSQVFNNQSPENISKERTNKKFKSKPRV